MKNILISIIIPCYNCEFYIKRLLESLMYNKYIEIIFVDDGSNDNSLNIAKGILINSKMNFTIISNKNNGVSYSRNCGIRNSNGKYIFFCDCDDFVKENFFQNIIPILINENPEVLLFGYDKVNYTDITWSYRNQFNYEKGVRRGIEIIKKYLNQDISISIWSMIIKSEIIKKNKLKFRENCYYCEDIEFLLKVLVNSDKVITLDRELYNYFERNDSAVNTFSNKRFSGLNALNGTKDYLVEKVFEEQNYILDLLNKIIVKEIIYIFFSYLSYSSKEDRNKKNRKKIKNIIKDNKDLIKNFTFDSVADKSLKIYRLALLTSPLIFEKIFIIKRYLKNLLKIIILKNKKLM